MGAINKTTSIKEYIAVDGIKHVTEILEKMYLNTIPKVKIIEAYSCVGGCVGGNFTFENPFVSKWRVNHYSNKISEEKSLEYAKKYIDTIYDYDWYFDEEIIAHLNPSVKKSVQESIKRMNMMNKLLDILPNIDCCACGFPTCRALAEDIVRGYKTIDECVVLKNSGDYNEN